MGKMSNQAKTAWRNDPRAYAGLAPRTSETISWLSNMRYSIPMGNLLHASDQLKSAGIMGYTPQRDLFYYAFSKSVVGEKSLSEITTTWGENA